MNFQNITKLAVALSFVVSFSAEARDYRNKRVGDYSNASTDISLSESNNTTFLTFMKETLYPLIRSEATNQTPYGVKHLSDIRNGIGAELKLAPDVTTYHVKYAGPWQDKADRSGRSFGVVNDGPIVPGQKVDYIADASYAFYLSELEEVLEDKEQAEIFFKAIFKVIIKTDSSEFLNPRMRYHTKRVAADFVAVYVAEQYRRLLKYDGQYVNYSPQEIAHSSWKARARRKPWDGAHLQTTILANFHAGQSIPGMYFAGDYMTQPYHQKSKVDGEDVCAYELLTNRNPWDDKLAKKAWQRPFKLKDYWQFGTECGGRSGVNVTRSDFRKLGRQVTKWLNRNGHQDDLAKIWTTSEQTIGTRRNVVDAIAHNIINDKAPESFANADALVDALVDFVMLAREKADDISKDL